MDAEGEFIVDSQPFLDDDGNPVMLEEEKPEEKPEEKETSIEIKNEANQSSESNSEQAQSP